MQPISFRKSATANYIRVLLENTRSKLMVFFNYNSTNEDTRGLLHVEFPGPLLSQSFESLRRYTLQEITPGRGVPAMSILGSTP